MAPVALAADNGTDDFALFGDCRAG